jgi:hypothetical protein
MSASTRMVVGDRERALVSVVSRVFVQHGTAVHPHEEVRP